MHVESLKVFCDVVRYHSFSRAAAVNSMSQSAASQTVLQLERSLGAQLIDRSRRPWVLTAQGKFFFDRCQELVEGYLELVQAMRRHQVSSGYKVRVAAIYSVGLQDMSHYEEEFEEALPGAHVDIEYMHPDRVYESVLRDETDLGLISFAHNGQELKAIPWRDEQMVVACLRSHRLAAQKAVRPADLKGERFVAFQKGLPIRREVDRFLKRHRVDIEMVAEFDNIATIKQAIEDAAGISILPEPTFRREVERRALVALPLTGKPFVRPLSIIHRRNRRLNSAVLRFLNLLQGNGAAPAVEAGPRGAGRRPNTKTSTRSSSRRTRVGKRSAPAVMARGAGRGL
jgi:DNA-binding transcriptional LysR family regulator